MSDQEEVCDLLQLVPNEEEIRLLGVNNEVSPPATPSICKIMAVTPASPTSNNVSSSGAGSVHGAGSQGSRNLSRVGQSLTPISTANTKFLYVTEKMPSASRRPSLLSEVSCRTPKELKPRMKELKKEVDAGSTWVDDIPGRVPPNTPSPSELMKTIEDNIQLSNLQIPDGSLKSGTDSSQMTTMALASESEDINESDSSSHTLKKSHTEKYKRPLLPLDRSLVETNTFSSSSGYFDSSIALAQSEPLRYSTFKSLASKHFLKSYWNQKNHQRNIQHHCFISDVTDVRRMEQALLHLLEDFHSGKLRAFAKDCSMEQMQGIREQQERLAKLHFDFGAQQELYAPLSEEGLRVNQENMKKLFNSLEQLSVSIEKLHSFSRDSSQE